MFIFVFRFYFVDGKTNNRLIGIENLAFSAAFSLRFDDASRSDSSESIARRAPVGKVNAA